MTQGAQNMFFGGVALLVSLATFIQGGKVPAQFLETLSYRGRGLKLIICIQNFNLLFAKYDTTPLPRYGPFFIAHGHNATSAFAVTPLMSFGGVSHPPKTNHRAKVELKCRISTQLSLFFIFYIEIHGETMGIGSHSRFYVLLNAQICAPIAYARNYSDKQTYGGLTKPFDAIFCGESPLCDMEVPPNVLVIGY